MVDVTCTHIPDVSIFAFLPSQSLCTSALRLFNPACIVSALLTVLANALFPYPQGSYPSHNLDHCRIGRSHRGSLPDKLTTLVHKTLPIKADFQNPNPCIIYSQDFAE